MKRFLMVAIGILTFTMAQNIAFAQTAGAIGGTVTDSTGAVVPNATVSVKGQSGQDFTVATSDNA